MPTVLLAVCFLIPGCIDESSGSANVTGQVLNQKFQAYSGFAEKMDDSYGITLTDSQLYDCTNTPGDAYLYVVVDAKAVGVIDARGNVSFNAATNPSTSSVEAADSGSVNIVEIDTVNQIIRGELNAAGATSQVSGDFDVKICP